MTALDRINRTKGSGTVHYAGEGLGRAVEDAVTVEIDSQHHGVGGGAWGEGMTLGLWFSTESTYSPARKRSL